MHADRTCRVDGCERPLKVVGLQLCTAHYKQHLRGASLERHCLDCGINISASHGACKRCGDCQAAYARVQHTTGKARRDAERRSARPCKSCGVEAVFGQFRYCQDCRESGMLATRRGNERRWRFARYGLTVDQFDSMLSANPLCPGCDADLRALEPHGDLAIDHCHETNKVRGLLCRKCNLALGLAQDSAAVLDALAAYRRKH